MTDRYAVFGNPIAHSKSPMIHKLFAEQTGQAHLMNYTAQRVDLGQFAQAAKKFFDEGGKGLNVTVPFKLDAYAFAEQNGSVSDRAKLAGAVNTLIRKDIGNGKYTIIGENTDGIGLVRDITQNLGWTIKGKSILVLGAGGAVRGVLGPLLAEQPTKIVIANRTKQKADELVDVFKSFGNLSVWDLRDIPSESFDLILNGTSASLGGDESDLSILILAAQVSNEVCAYDMVYGVPSPFAHMSLPIPQPGVSVPLTLKLELNSTPFQSKANMRDIPISNGLGMLVEQAAESFCLWRNVRYEQLDTKKVIDQVRSQL